jgi:hypothetical protein
VAEVFTGNPRQLAPWLTTEHQGAFMCLQSGAYDHQQPESALRMVGQ